MDKLVGVFFVALPYVTLAIFIIGTVYRYFYQGYKISSLSTQIFETKLLYWGSNAFHFGILALFLGHLIGFILPSTVIAIGGIPARIIAIEIGAFAFAILSMIGLLTLLLRRVTNQAILKVTSKMDIVIYTFLILQVFAGMYIALFYKWGSLWFASSLAPYLKSIFILSPDIKAVVDMPLMIQLHVILAFIIFALIPFSRLMHVLVYPFVYIGRAAQIFIWNRDPKTHRGSRKMFQGEVPRKN